MLNRAPIGRAVTWVSDATATAKLDVTKQLASRGWAVSEGRDGTWPMAFNRSLINPLIAAVFHLYFASLAHKHFSVSTFGIALHARAQNFGHALNHFGNSSATEGVLLKSFREVFFEKLDATVLRKLADGVD